MAIWGTVPVAEVVKANRLDGEYFKPQDLAEIKRISINGGMALGAVAEVLTGRTPSEYKESGGVSVVRSGDLGSSLIYPECGRSFLRTEKFAGCTSLQRGDVLISSIGMGAIGKISLVIDPTDLVTVSEVTILRNSIISPSFLFAYLRSAIGQAQIEREITGATGQQHLLKSKVAQIMVPVLPKDIESPLVDYVNRSHEQEVISHLAFEEATDLLEQDLGLNKLDLGPQLSFTRTSHEIHASSRLDAEFFQPRVRNLLKALSQSGQVIGDVAALSKRRFRPTRGVDFQYIEIGDISGNGLAASRTVLGECAPSRAAWIVKPGDLITTTVRPIRRISAIVQKEQENFVCSSGFAVITPQDPSDIPPELLLVFLKLPLVAELLDLHTTSSMYPAISTADILGIPFMNPSNSIKDKVVSCVQRAFAARDKSIQLLQESQALVESALLEK